MWQEVIEYDPVSGVRTDYWNDGKKWGIYTQQDMGKAKEFARQAMKFRDDDGYKADGIKNSLLHVARIPVWVHEKLYTEYGIKQPLRQGEEVLKIIQRDFPWCMCAKGSY